ncbi:type II toxin-antitoxin system death-on-curing family toxin [Clostridium oryzae]|uniref:Toxin Doc n=1 Tax=Clostridium oryzae TaxID=1450648 RepID=A0A1V4IXL7_9CLOT|nr:toxin Doc [Clostridium oryzae]
MRHLSKEQMIHLHSIAIRRTGGLDGIRDEGLLESALSSPFQSFGGEELYPSIQAKAARLGFSIIKNHPF